MHRGTFQRMKSTNKLLTLNKIRADEPTSRAQIAKETRLTPPTIGHIVKELIDEGIVRESDQATSHRGRKPTMLMINKEAFFIIGVDAGPKTINCILTDLSGKVIERSTFAMQRSVSNESFMATMKKGIQAVIENTSVSSNIAGIGIAMHGVVDVDAGISVIAPNLNLKNVPLKAELEKAFGLTVKVENDARAMALGESWFGKHGNLNNMLAINIGHGVGAGIILNGKLYHGAMDIAGEIGHMMIDPNGDICECGNRGCLQTLITGNAIGRRASKEVKPIPAQLKKETKYSTEGLKNELSGEEVYRLAVSGDKHYKAVLEETGKMIGMGLTNLIHVINPELIVLGGGVTKSKEFLFPQVQQSIEKHSLTSEAKQTKVVISDFGDDATLLGAVSLILVELFDPDF